MLQAACPSCGSEVLFNMNNSVVTVCESCDSVVGRADGKLEDYGKVADLVKTESPLRIGLQGMYRKQPFEITGRTQYKHAAGGVWNEWYASFEGGKHWGWIAESQGKIYLTFNANSSDESRVGSLDAVRVEDEITIARFGRLKVIEVGEALLVSAEGEIPFKFEPNEIMPYADLVGAAGRFASISGEGDTPDLYVGHEVSWKQLGLEHIASEIIEAEIVAAVTVNCPQCAGALDLKAPDESERCVCPNCNSLLDVNDGNLKYLHTLQQAAIAPKIPLGTVGTLRGREYTVIGFMQRLVVWNTQKFYWYEYLLYTPRMPFHWLIHNNGHWSLGKPISAGDVKQFGSRIKHAGHTYKLFDKSHPMVTCVLGEFYWKVSIGEQVRSSDYVAPPYMLSREATEATYEIGANRDAPDYNMESSELTYTVSEYIPVNEIKKSFKVNFTGSPTGVAPNQPFRYKNLYPAAFILFAVAVTVILFAMVVAPRRTVYQNQFQLLPSSEEKVTRVSEPMELAARQNICVTCQSPVDNSWIYVEGVFYNEETGEALPFTSSVEYWHGTTGGESWSEGSKKKNTFVTAPRKGTYTLRLDSQWKEMGSPTTLDVKVRQGVPRLLYPGLLLAFLILMPALVMVAHYLFDVQRWSDSDFSPYESG